MVENAVGEFCEIKREMRADSAPPARILVLGLGNEILKDDAVGILVAEKLRGHFPDEVEVRSTSLFGLSLLDELIDQDKVLLIDSFLPESPSSAKILEITLDSLGNSQAVCPHFVGLAEIREVMRSLDLGFPREVRIVAIPVTDPLTFSTELSSEVAARVDEAVEYCHGIVQSWLHRVVGKQEAAGGNRKATEAGSSGVSECVLSDDVNSEFRHLRARKKRPDAPSNPQP